MTLVITHLKVLPGPDDDDPNTVSPTDWNIAHTLTGTADASQLNANVVQAVVNDTNIAGSIALQALTFAWSGTLALSRFAQGTDGQVVVGQTSAASQYKTLTGALSLSAAGATALTTSAFANPSASVGLSAINGSATTAMRSDGAPALSQAIAPIWTGAHTFNPASGNAITVNPAAASTARGLTVTQTGAGASIAGPLAYNLFDITNAATSSTAGSDGYGLFNKNIGGVRVNFSANANTTVQEAVLVAGKLSLANAGDTMGLNASMYSNIVSTGAIYGVVGNAFIDASGSGSRALGGEFDVAIATGGTAPYRIGANITSYGNVAGSTLDSGVVISANPLLAPGIGFSKGITLSNIYGVAPIATTGDVFYVDSAQTVANVFNCTNLAVTGSIFNFQNFFLTNTNSQNATTQISLTNSSAGAAVSIQSQYSNGTNSLTAGIGGTGLTGAYQGKGFVTANGSAALIVGTSGSQPYIQYVNNAEAGRWDSVVPGTLNIGTVGALVGQAAFFNATSGSITVKPQTGALGTAALTLPAVTATVLTTSNAGGTISSASNSLGADVALNNTANYFDGPSAAQGTSGTWFASGTVTLTDTVGAGVFNVKLWDGTTVIDSCQVGAFGGANSLYTATLSGVISSPAANLRISVRDTASTSGKILFNQSGNSKDSTVTAIRIG